MTTAAPQISIVTATAADIPLLSALANNIWPRVYSQMISQEQIRYMLDAFYNAEALQKQMDEQQVFSLVWVNGEAAGFASYTPSPQDGTTKLNKLYLVPEVQGLGLGRLLIEFVEEAARRLGSTQLILNVNRNNPALAFYQRCGFRVAEEIDIPIGPFWMNDYVMSKDLN